MAIKEESVEARETVYAAIELSNQTWALGIATPDRDRPSIYRITGGNLGELAARLRAAAREERLSISTDVGPRTGSSSTY